ncbi:MAG: AIPR family protein [Muribaculaceae bacterium]|nr:AIPR family protein [Muribaculaceae bacterium]
MSIIDKIQKEIKQDFYQTNFPNDGQRFVAWYLRNVFLLDKNSTKDAITDGPKDKQIDAVYIDEDNQKIYIIQSKFYTGPTVGSEPVREMQSVWLQLSDLKNMQANANGKLKIKLAEIANALEEDSYSVCLMLITTSSFSDEAQKDIAFLHKEISDKEDDSKYDFEFVAVDGEDVAENYSRAVEQSNPILSYTMPLQQGKYMYTEIGATSVLIVAVPLRECIKLPGIKDGSLFQKNVRQSLGITNSVNKKIKKTIYSEKCNEFFFFHNGITAICNKMDMLDDGTVKFIGLNVVNGCQSLNTILSCSEKVKNEPDSYVLFRFYEIPQRDRADSISINTNTQSAVKARDLRSNDKRVLRMKRAYEQRFSEGYFATKRGESIPADKKRDFTVELAYLGKQLTAWYMQRPNLSYGETKIFDKYFNTLFKVEYSPEDIFALNFWMNKIMEAWKEENPLGLNDVILTMKAYAPYHLLFAVSMIFAKSNNQSSVPSPAETLTLAQKADKVDEIIQLAAACLNIAIDSEEQASINNSKTFIPQNWIKNKSSLNAINFAVLNMFNFNPNSKMLKAALKMAPDKFSYRVQADD